MDLSETQQQVVAFRSEGTKLYRTYCQTELELYRNYMNKLFSDNPKRCPLNPENKQINFESYKINPKLSPKQLEKKVVSAEKALTYSFKMY